MKVHYITLLYWHWHSYIRHVGNKEKMMPMLLMLILFIPSSQTLTCYNCVPLIASFKARWAGVRLSSVTLWPNSELRLLSVMSRMTRRFVSAATSVFLTKSYQRIL